MRPASSFGVLMPPIRALLTIGACAVALLSGCADQSATAPATDGDPQFARGSKGLRVTPARLAFTAIGERGTLTASTPTPGGLTAEVSSPACVSVTPRRVTRSPGKFTVTATAGGTCSVTITDGIHATIVVPIQVVLLQRGTLANGYSHTCGLTGTGAAYCWGSNRWGQLGTTTNSGTTTPNSAPLAVQGGLTFTRLTAGLAHTCGLAADGSPYCWGANSAGALGSATNSGGAVPNPAPLRVSSSLTFTRLTAGWEHTCGLTTEGSAYCWGYNYWGALGSTGSVGEVTPNPEPVAVEASVAFTELEAGENHTCGLTAGGEVYCWGRNNWGQLGTDLNLNTGNPTPTPQLVEAPVAFAQLAAGGSHTCALTMTGAAHCWGRNEFGELGRTEGYESGFGVPASGAVDGSLVFTALAGGGDHTCGVTGTGAAYCWGRNYEGQLGSSTVTPYTRTPLPVGGDLALIAVSAGYSQTCGVSLAGAAYCWGLNIYGELGTTTSLGSLTSTPQPVGGGLLFAMP